MKIGLCAFFEKFKLLQPGIADYIEIPLFDIERTSIQELKEHKARLDSLGLAAETSNGFLPGTDIMMCGKNYDVNKIIDYSRRAFDKASIFGIKTFVFGSASARSVAEGESFEECLKQINEGYFAASEVAKEYGVDIALEPINAKEGNTLNTVSEGADLVRRLAHPNLFLLVDYFHLFQEEKPDHSVIINNADIIRHMHIAHPVTRKAPKATDGYDYSVLKKATDAANYGGYISVEAIFEEDYYTDAKDSVSFLRKLFE